MVLKIVNGGLDRVSSGHWPKAIQMRPSVLSSLESDGSYDGQAGRLDRVTDNQRHSKLS
jgi:hypothetical protein